MHKTSDVLDQVSDTDVEAVGADEYIFIGRVTEFRHGTALGDIIRKNGVKRLSQLWNYGESWGQLRSHDALVFTDNHDTQRDWLNSTLTFFDSNMYKIANAFQLAWDYGHVRIMSSYYWPRRIVDEKDQVCQIYLFPGASLPISSGRSLRPVKIVGDFFLN